MSQKVKSGQVVKISIHPYTTHILFLKLPGNTQIYKNSANILKYREWIKSPEIGIILREIRQDELFIKAFDGDEKGELAILTNNDMVISYSAWRNLLTSTFYEILCSDMKIIFRRGDFKRKK